MSASIPPAPPSPVNERSYAHADLALRRMLEAAGRGDVAARLSVIEAGAADRLRTALARLAAAADACAPDHDQIRIDGGPNALDRRELRYAADAAIEALSAAAGRAVVVDIAAARAAQDASVVERTGADVSCDSGEFPTFAGPGGSGAA